MAHYVGVVGGELGLHLAHLRELVGLNLLLIGQDVLEAVEALVRRLAALAPRILLSLASAGVDRWRLLHHLRQELLRLTALRGSFLVQGLLLGLHSSIVKGVHSRVGAAVDASVGGVEPLGLRRDGVRDVLAGRVPGAPLEVLLRHGDISAGVERRCSKASILRAGELILIIVAHL